MKNTVWHSQSGSFHDYKESSLRNFAFLVTAGKIPPSTTVMACPSTLELEQYKLGDVVDWGAVSNGTADVDVVAASVGSKLIKKGWKPTNPIVKLEKSCLAEFNPRKRGDLRPGPVLSRLREISQTLLLARGSTLGFS